ncbi:MULTISPECIES: MFS transporter [unclassified Bradyrhizobium]|uniref:MFS transporter n=1 Tax=unclassified Bradyrhizobium TaxID=2631580 RepID=UPI001BA99188|nr:MULTISPECIES: MFS transporter [unclassified Bradyrhizobium]MBR1226721.1 MFS transporter [Bradyrhizobium sp. AUGA SZCCT0176]MBR1299499.1 MFS transporter [Bradyrhizobium sp. AUGA SZCCT0042]
MIPAQDAGQSDETLLRYAGWRVVLACFLMALFLFGFGLYGHGVYLAELQRLNGWPAALISGASTVSLLLANIFATFTNELMTRLGPRRLVLFGIAALTASMTLLAFAATPWQLYIAFALMSLGWIGMGTIVSATIVSLWFVRRRGLAISLAFTGASFSGVIVTPSLVYLVERFGFAAAMMTGTAVMVAVLVPVTVAWIGPPSAGGPADPLHAETPSVPSDISRAKLIRRVAFWTISIPFALALVAQIGFIVHQIAMLEPKIGRANAGLAVSVMTLMAIAGRFGLGMVVDRFDPRRVTAISIVSQAAALLSILHFDAIPIVLAACAVFGFSVGNLITLPPLIMHREFSAASFVVVMGLSNAISGTIGSLGPAFLGVVQSWTGGYETPIALCIALQLIAAVIVVQRGRPAAAEGRG